MLIWHFLGLLPFARGSLQDICARLALIAVHFLLITRFCDRMLWTLYSLLWWCKSWGLSL